MSTRTVETNSNKSSNITGEENSHLPQGRIVSRGGEDWFEVENSHRIPSFLMTMISDKDHWLFINSDGSLTLGRRNPDHALLPYYTHDKLQDVRHETGGVTVMRVKKESGEIEVWSPFKWAVSSFGNISRHIRKSKWGNAIQLEEYHEGLGLRFLVTWRPSSKYGFVRKLELLNVSKFDYEISIVDGLQNLLCPGMEARFQNEYSNLGDAYKQGELVGEAAMGLYCLSSQPTDLAQPKEALRANAVWSLTPNTSAVSLDSSVVEPFRQTGEFKSVEEMRGKRLAHIVHQELKLGSGVNVEWYNCADVDLDRVKCENLIEHILSCKKLSAEIEANCELTTIHLKRMLAEADAQLASRNKRGEMRHISNTVFNLMRGGALPTGYEFPHGDLVRTVANFNKVAAKKLAEFENANGPLTITSAWNNLEGKLDRNALRLAREYLPLTFSRRHGDPSRPWNRFSIDVEHADGSPRYAYQGNWRDIFQNWEALLQGYPEYIFSAIGRFLNASSADGYNPYRLTKEGFEWEEISPDDPWANIGYWGDHQIIYLLKLLETAAAYYPSRLKKLLDQKTYVYAQIPYRISTYAEMLKDPRETVSYDAKLAEKITERVKEKGSDGKLIHVGEEILYVSFLEKLLVPMMAKLSNFIPGGGIWMNTQRPEWNDANNALVGFGVSVVTAGYLYRYLEFIETELDETLKDKDYELSNQIVDWLEEQVTYFSSTCTQSSDADRKVAMDRLGESATTYREHLYKHGLSGDSRKVEGNQILKLIRGAKEHLKSTLLANKREDGLYHSYNLLDFQKDSVSLKYLYPMLEGQVSILSSGLLSGEDGADLLDALRKSSLYREDQNTYLLYPDRALPGFRFKNRVSADAVEECGNWKARVLAGKTKLLTQLKDGTYAFNADLVNATALRGQLAKESENDLTDEEKNQLVELYETVFNHKSFTGRSGTFFAYEGLGSIYWHMVSKLALAAQELLDASHTKGDFVTVARLKRHYFEIKEGLGVNKPAWKHGAIPTDAYSHTPKHAGAQQPGMTGQVKEDILSRLKELGLSIHKGEIRFSNHMLSWKEEALTEPATMEFIHLDGKSEQIRLPSNSILFSFCQVPVIYELGNSEQPVIDVIGKNSLQERMEGHGLTAKVSESIFKREGLVRCIRVQFPNS